MYQDYLLDAAEYDREMSYRKAIIEREKRVREGIGDSACSRLPRRWAKPMNPSSRAAAASRSAAIALPIPLQSLIISVRNVSDWSDCD